MHSDQDNRKLKAALYYIYKANKLKVEEREKIRRTKWAKR